MVLPWYLPFSSSSVIFFCRCSLSRNLISKITFLNVFSRLDANLQLNKSSFQDKNIMYSNYQINQNDITTNSIFVKLIHIDLRRRSYTHKIKPEANITRT